MRYLSQDFMILQFVNSVFIDFCKSTGRFAFFLYFIDALRM